MIWAIIVIVALVLIVVVSLVLWWIFSRKSSTDGSATMLIGVDLQVNGSTTFQGADAGATTADGAFADAGVWNHIDIPQFGRGLTTQPGLKNLVDSTGIATPVSFMIKTTKVGAFDTRGRHELANGAGYGDLANDYFYFNQSGMDTTIDWEISGLVPSSEYKLFIHSTPEQGNVTYQMKVDTMGSGTLDDETAVVVGAAGKMFAVKSDSNGKVIGQGIGGASTTQTIPDDPPITYESYPEARWAGWQLYGPKPNV